MQGTVGPLSGLKVLEVAGAFGDYAGKLLADLGADGDRVEPPGGMRRGGGRTVHRRHAAPSTA